MTNTVSINFVDDIEPLFEMCFLKLASLTEEIGELHQLIEDLHKKEVNVESRVRLASIAFALKQMHDSLELNEEIADTIQGLVPNGRS